jgi:hypothetical protein
VTDHRLASEVSKDRLWCLTSGRGVAEDENRPVRFQKSQNSVDSFSIDGHPDSRFPDIVRLYLVVSGETTGLCLASVVVEDGANRNRLGFFVMERSMAVPPYLPAAETDDCSATGPLFEQRWVCLEVRLVRLVRLIRVPLLVLSACPFPCS